MTSSGGHWRVLTVFASSKLLASGMMDARRSTNSAKARFSPQILESTLRADHSVAQLASSRRRHPDI